MNAVKHKAFLAVKLYTPEAEGSLFAVKHFAVFTFKRCAESVKMRIYSIPQLRMVDVINELVRFSADSALAGVLLNARWR